MPDFKFKKIQMDKTLGDILKVTRKRKKISLTEAEEETKVREKYLEALEDGRYEALPGNVYALGFLSKYIDFLGLNNKNELMNRFRLERGESPMQSRLAPNRQLKEPLLFLTPKLMTILVIVLILAGVLGYIIYSVRSFTQPPNLQISSPSSEQVLKEDQVDIIGKTDAGITLLINGQAIIADGNGNFRQTVKLTPGLNTFEIKAINRLKKENIRQIKILAEF